MLTNEQRLHFQTFGFLVLKALYSKEEMNTLTDAFDRVLAEDRQNRPFTGEKRQGVLSFCEKDPTLIQLITDDRIYTAVQDLLGEELFWIGSDANLYVGDSQWHPDGNHLLYKTLKIAFYLDSVRADSGCLRVIPGSHHSPLHEQIRVTMSQGISGRDVPYFALESDPGDVVIFNHRVWHSSFGGKTGRRMMTLNFGEKPWHKEQIDHVQKTYDVNLNQTIKELQVTHTEHMYPESFFTNENPRIRALVSKLIELNFR